MSITILDAMKLDSFKRFRLVAGHKGLEKEIDSVGILDYEFFTETEEKFYRGQFSNKGFIISSLLFAKNNDGRILLALKYLVEDGVTGMAIKNVFYNDLPEEVINFANDKSFPIFIFDNSVFFEDIITEIMDRLRASENYTLMESKITFLLKKDIDKETIRELLQEINIHFKENFFVLCLKGKKTYIDDNNFISIIKRFKINKNIKNDTSMIKYKDNILIIYSFNKADKNNSQKNVLNLLYPIGLCKEDYFIGVSNIHFTLDDIKIGINESLFATEVSSISDKSLNLYKDIGIYKILLPFINDHWMLSFYNELILPLKEYDEKHNTDMFYTAVKYVENDGINKNTSENLFIHENTLRYRINKIKQILQFRDKDGSFFEQLSIAIKLYKIYETKNRNKQ